MHDYVVICVVIAAFSFVRIRHAQFSWDSLTFMTCWGSVENENSICPLFVLPRYDVYSNGLNICSSALRESCLLTFRSQMQWHFYGEEKRMCLLLSLVHISCYTTVIFFSSHVQLASSSCRCNQTLNIHLYSRRGSINQTSEGYSLNKL